MQHQHVLNLSCIILTSILGFWLPRQSVAQTGTLQGNVRDNTTKEPLISATVLIEGTSLGAITDIDGNYTIRDIPNGTYTVRAQYIGYQTSVRNQVLIEGGVTQVSIGMETQQSETDTLVITANQFSKTSTNIISSRTLGVEQIRTNPGGNFDVSRVVQSLPGVSGAIGFRNDIIVRGGAPNENVFYLDDVEIPNINHFATQGSGGGPVGIINAIFIENLNFQSSAFGAQYDNTLSSVLDFQMIDGNRERLQGTALVSATDAGVTLDGPVGKNARGIFSARRSYLQLLFDAIGLPFLPDYWDFQGKMTFDLGPKTSLTLVGIGAIDRISFKNPEDVDPERLYILDGFPSIRQDTYTVGANLKHRTPNGYWQVVMSRNWLRNNNLRQDAETGATTLDYRSDEGENKLRFNVLSQKGGWTLRYGLNSQLSRYFNSTFLLRGTPQGNVTIDYLSELYINRWGAYGSASKRFLNKRLLVNMGVRTDMNDFTDDGMNPLETISPRISASYSLTDNWRINASSGIYYKLPPYTVLGFRDQEGLLVNQNSRYIRSTHYAAGLEYQPEDSWLFSVEGFYKLYDNYPVSLIDSISLANKGGDFGILGDEPVSSSGNGRAYGVEFFVQKLLTNRLYGTVSYTLYWSEFSGLRSSDFIRSSWDNRNLVALTWGYMFGKTKQWEIAAKWRYLGPNPYTPFDLAASTQSYTTTGQPVLDNSRVNAAQTAGFNQLDIRLERKFFFKKWSLIVFIDIQNATSSPNAGPPNFTLERDPLSLDFLQPFQPLLLENETSALIPSLGFRARF